jgi:glucokinase
MKYYLGIDIGGTKTAGAIVTEAGLPLALIQHPTDADRGGAQVLRSAIDAADELLSRYPDARAIGVGAGGQIDPATGVVVSATQLLPGWAGITIGESFRAAFGIPVAVDNDVNALASGEIRFGAAKGCDTVLFLALGTGVGGALAIGGRIHHGAHFTGGEFGHVLLDIAPKARIDSGGARGTLEAFCSGAGLVQTWREMTGEEGLLVTARDIAALADKDPAGPAALAISRTGMYLGYGLASLANAIDPDIIVIGGGLSALGHHLFGPARRALRERGLPGPAICPIVPASLGEHASVIGAATLAMAQ